MLIQPSLDLHKQQLTPALNNNASLISHSTSQRFTTRGKRLLYIHVYTFKPDPPGLFPVSGMWAFIQNWSLNSRVMLHRQRIGASA